MFFLGQVMSSHHSDQMSLCSVMKSLIVSSVRARYQATKGHGHLLSCQWTANKKMSESVRVNVTY